MHSCMNVQCGHTHTHTHDSSTPQMVIMFLMIMGKVRGLPTKTDLGVDFSFKGLRAALKKADDACEHRTARNSDFDSMNATKNGSGGVSVTVIVTVTVMVTVMVAVMVMVAVIVMVMGTVMVTSAALKSQGVRESVHTSVCILYAYKCVYYHA